MICSQCGHKNEEGSAFCANCGTKIEPMIQEALIEEDVIENSVETQDEEAVSAEEIVVSEVLIESSDSCTDADVCKSAEELSAAEPTVIDENDNITNADPIFSQSFSSDNHTEKTTTVIKNKKKTGVFAHICGVLLSILLSAFLVATLSIASISIVFSSGTISSVIKEVDIANIDVDDLISKRELEEMGIKCESDNLLDVVYDNIDQSKLADPLTKSEYRDIVESDAFNDYFGKLIDKRLDSVLAGKETQLFSADDVIEFLKIEKKEIKKVIGYEINDEKIENLEKNLDKNFDKAFDSLKVDLDNSPEVKIVGIFFANWLLPVLILIDVLICVLIFLIVRSVRCGMNYCGTTLLIVSSLFVLVSLVLYFGVNQFLAPSIIYNIVGSVSLKIMIMNLCVFASSILLLITSAIIKRFAR